MTTCRDVAHRRLVEGGRELPVDVRDAAIFHAGPIIRPLGDEKYEMVSVGPTTSMRMEKFEYEFVKETGVRVIVGIRKDSCAGVHRSFSVLQISSFSLS